MAVEPTGVTESSQFLRMLAGVLHHADRTAFSEVLRTISEQLGCFGCVVWEAWPSYTSDPGDINLFAFAQWFTDQTVWRVHELPGRASLAGVALRDGRTTAFADVATDPRIGVEPFLSTSAVRSLCVSPLIFADGAAGVLALYRREPRSFSKDELSQIETVASALPSIYQAVHDRLSVKLISTVDDLLTLADSIDEHQAPGPSPLHLQLTNICGALSETFGCGRVSLLLRAHAADDRGRWFTTAGPLSSENAARPDGVSDWVLANKRAIRLLDIREAFRQPEFTQRMYPGLTVSQTSLREEEEATRLERHSHSGIDHPIGMMAVPVLIRGVSFGLLRCVGSHKGPDYFASRDLQLLETVASRLSHFWSNFLSHRALLEENRSWQMLVESLGRMDSYAQQRLKRAETSEVETLEQSLQVVARAMPMADQLAIRLFDEQRQELYFAAVAGEAWSACSTADVDPRRIRFRVEPRELGGDVLLRGRASVSTARDGASLSRPFELAKILLTVPIASTHTIYGVLDIASTQSDALPPHAESIAELLGRQIGLYHFLGATVAQLRSKERELHDFVRHQHWTYQDFEHQLRSPVLQAHRRVHALLQRHQLGDRTLETELFRIRGLLAKANRVAMNTRLFASIATDTPIAPVLESTEISEIVRLLIEAASDAQCLVDPRRHIRFTVDQSSRVASGLRIDVDRSLLLMAISNLLDNAGEYSYADSCVSIGLGLDKRGCLSISVSNRGLPLKPDEVNQVSRRGFRGTAAAAVTGEGSGIGLWIVDWVMKAHSGDLVIVPTSKDGVTVFRLRFPPQRVK